MKVVRLGRNSSTAVANAPWRGGGCVLPAFLSHSVALSDFFAPGNWRLSFRLFDDSLLPPREEDILQQVPGTSQLTALGGRKASSHQNTWRRCSGHPLFTPLSGGQAGRQAKHPGVRVSDHT